MTNRPRSNPEPARRPVTKRQQAYQTREANLQRRVVLGIAGAVLLALLIIVAGVVYDRFVVPGRTVKAVNGETLSRGEYDQVTRRAALQQIAQSAQFAKLLGANASFGQDQGGSFSQQIVQTNQQLAQIGTIRGRSQPVADEAVSQWVDAQLVEQAAKTQFQIDPSQGEVDQLIVERLGNLLQQPETATSTGAVTETAGAATSVAATGAAGTTGPGAAAATTATAEATPNVSPTSGPTPTASPTVPPTASPVADVATQKAGQIFGIIFNEYQAVLNDLPREASPDLRSTHATQEEFGAALRAQYRDELIRTRVKEKLVPELRANDTGEPTQIRARHILLKVPKPTPTPAPAATSGPDATPEATSAAAAETATAEPTPTATLAPAALEALFAERKAEADAIYQQVTSNPETFADLAREKSEDEGSAPQGGDLNAFGRGQMVKPFEDAAFKLKENEISQPVRSDFGWHIIQRLPEDPKEKLERQRQTAFDEWVANLRLSATIVPAPTPTPTAPPAPSEVQTEEPPASGATEATPGATGAAPAATAAPAASPAAEGTTATP